MSRHITIRGGLAATIAGYTLLLILVIVAGIAGLYGSNTALREMYRDDTASLLHLKTSSERLLLLRGGLGEVEQLISAGKPATAEVKRLHALLAESSHELDAYRTLHEPDAAEKPLVDAMQTKRDQLLTQAFQKALKQLDEDNFVDFLSTQREMPAALFADYQNALTALEDFQVQRQKARFDQADARFRAMLWTLGAAGVIALVIGVLAQRTLARAIVQPINMAVDYFGRIAAGDLTSTVTVQRDNEMGYLLNALKGMQNGLVETVRKVRASTESIVHDARAIAGGNLDLSVRTEQQASSMDAISGSSSRIVGIVGVIEGIAFQTNILALNAAVEAARAGEQGRGFAVVASEVRNLAQRSAAAAKEIKELIGDSTLKVRDGSELVARAGSTMDEVVQAVSRVNAIMAEISLASSEQTTGIELVNTTVTQMEEMTQQNSALVEEASAAAVSLEEQSRQLNDAVAVFRLQEDRSTPPASPVPR